MNSLDPLKVLLVEDDEDDYVLTRGLFNEMKGPRLQIDWIANFDQGLNTMIENRHDVCLVDYRLGARNGVSCGSIEHKMGIHGNSTCVMNYDGATGWLIGEENKGMQGMFVMMNEARLGVAVQGLAQSEVAYQNAVQ